MWSAMWPTGHRIRIPINVLRHLNDQEKSLRTLHINYQKTWLRCCSLLSSVITEDLGSEETACCWAAHYPVPAVGPAWEGPQGQTAGSREALLAPNGTALEDTLPGTDGAALTFGRVGFRQHPQPVGRDGCQRQVIEAHPRVNVESFLIISFHVVQLGHDQIGFL